MADGAPVSTPDVFDMPRPTDSLATSDDAGDDVGVFNRNRGPKV